MSTESHALTPVVSEAAEAGVSVDPWQHLRVVPMRLSVDIAMPALSIRTLNALRTGTVLSSLVPIADDLPVTIGETLVSWARFECTDGRMAVRLTRLA